MTIDLSAARRRTCAALGLALLVTCVGAGGCSADDRPRADRPPTESNRSGSGPADTGGSSSSATPSSVPPSVARLRTHLDELAAVLPHPPEVLDCIAAQASGDPDLEAAILAADPDHPTELEPLGETAQGCTHKVIAAPQFADDQQRAANGALTPEQLSCLETGFADLPPETAALAAAAAVDPANDGPSLRQATTAIRDVMIDCGLDPGPT